jgi:putative oxidoreductase
MKMTRLKKAVTWSLQIVLAMIFLTVGMAKISGVQSSVDMFQRIGMGQWLRYLVGMVEVACSVLLLFGPYASLGAGVLMIVMAGAVMSHLWLIGGSVAPAMGLGLIAGGVLYLRRQIQRSEQIEVIHQQSHKKSA